MADDVTPKDRQRGLFIRPGSVHERDAAVRHAYLRGVVQSADRARYEEDAPPMSETAYELLRQEMLTLEALYPDLRRRPDSGA
jgi:NAD-dependent DNA ligase